MVILQLDPVFKNGANLALKGVGHFWALAGSEKSVFRIHGAIASVLRVSDTRNNRVRLPRASNIPVPIGIQPTSASDARNNRVRLLRVSNAR
eukprot:6817264-Pyramimonas_sp.AAC.1